MVDPLGAKPVQTPALTGERIASVARVVPTAAVAPTTGQTAAQAATSGQSALAATAREAAASPPVDLDRVAKIRKAVAEGNFPIYPATIADRLIASKYDWLRNDA